MKKITYGMPDNCPHCGNTDVLHMTGDWSHMTCNKCHKVVPYKILKEEDDGK